MRLSAPLIPLLGAEPTSIPSFTGDQSQMPPVHGSISRWPLGIGDIEPLLRAKAGVLFLPSFELMASWLAAQTVKLFGFHCNRSYLITNRSKHAVGYATVDTELSETGEYYYTVPVVQGYKWEHNKRWRFTYAAILQTVRNKRVMVISAPDVIFNRVGVAIIMSDYWSGVELPTTLNVC
jgi:hypothetical protein